MKTFKLQRSVAVLYLKDNGVESNVCYLEAGVPQGSILGPLLFLIYINDIVEDMECNINIFADDTSVQQSIIDINSFEKVNRDLQRLTVLENSGSYFLMH